MPDHFDLAAAEASMRADTAAAAAHGQRMAELGEADGEFLACQREFDEARIQFLLACLRAENAGIDRNLILSSAGHAVGSIWGGALHGAIGARERAVLNGWVRLSLHGALRDGAADKTIETVLRPMESGSA